MLDSIDTQLTILKKACPAEFEITDILGSGGYGVVAKAYDRLMARTVAIKFLTRLDGNDKSQLKRFQTEGTALARLQHPNIVSVLQMGLCKNELPFIVYEYLNGITLAEYLSEHKTLSPQLLSCVFAQILAGISHAHKMGVIHGDIAPGNIMLLDYSVTPTESESFKVKILDFGLARITESTIQHQIASTATNTTKTLRGNPFYMSPEQCRGEPADERSDYYSMACVFYQCLTGHPPFAGDSPLHVLYKHLNEQPQLARDLPDSLKKLFEQSLAKSRSNRPESTTQFRLLIQRAVEDLRKKDFARSLLPGKQILILLALCVLSSLSMILVKNLWQTTKNTDNTYSEETAPEPRAQQAIQMSPELRLKRILLERTKMELDTREDQLRILEEITNLIPSVRSKTLLYTAYANKGILENRLGRYEVGRKSFKQSYEYSLVGGKESLHSAYPLFNMAVSEKYMSSSQQDASIKSKLLKVVSLIDQAKHDETGLNPPRLELDEELDLINSDGLKSDALSKLASLSQDYDESKKLGEQAIYAYQAHDALSHAYSPIMTLVTLHMEHKNEKEARAWIHHLEKSLVEDVDCRDQLDRICTARALAAWYLSMGEEKKAKAIAEMGIKIGIKEGRQKNAVFHDLLREYESFGKEEKPNRSSGI